MLEFLFNWVFDYKFNDPTVVYCYLNLGFHHYAIWFIVIIVVFVYYCLLNIMFEYNWFFGLKFVGFIRLSIAFILFYAAYLYTYLSINYKNINKKLFFFWYYSTFILFYFFNNVIFYNLFALVLKYIKNPAFIRIRLLGEYKEYAFNINLIKFIKFFYSVLKYIKSFKTFRAARIYLGSFKDNLKIYKKILSKPIYNNIKNIFYILNKKLDFNVLALKPAFYSLYYIFNSFVISYGFILPKHFFSFFNKHSAFKNKFFRHNLKFELIVSLGPLTIVYLLVVPSLAILYQSAEVEVSEVTVNIIANQWYWVYTSIFGEVSGSYSFSSYMVFENFWKVSLGSPRLLTVDNALIIPTFLNIKFLVTSADVLHAWSIPSWSVKIDAVPGRLTEVIVNIFSPGGYFGQCSELCGVEHGFMPIHVWGVEPSMFLELKNDYYLFSLNRSIDYFFINFRLDLGESIYSI